MKKNGTGESMNSELVTISLCT